MQEITQRYIYIYYNIIIYITILFNANFRAKLFYKYGNSQTMKIGTKSQIKVQSIILSQSARQKWCRHCSKWSTLSKKNGHYSKTNCHRPKICIVREIRGGEEEIMRCTGQLFSTFFV